MADGLKGFVDLADMSEDERIELMARHVRTTGQTVAVCVDDDPGKPERYADKLTARGCVVTSRYAGPIAGVVTLEVGPADGN